MQDELAKIELIPIDKLVKNEKNPREISPKEFRNLCDSIKKDPTFMQCRPLLCDENYLLYAGHQRLDACKALGWDKVPCIVTPGLTQEQKDERMIKDNHSNGQWLVKKLKVNFDNSMIEGILGIDIFNELKDKVKPIELDKMKLYNQMDLKGFENYDYLVFIFRDLTDFQNACQKYGVERVEVAMVRGKTERIGLGRVLDGKKLLS